MHDCTHAYNHMEVHVHAMHDCMHIVYNEYSGLCANAGICVSVHGTWQYAQSVQSTGECGAQLNNLYIRQLSRLSGWQTTNLR